MSVSLVAQTGIRARLIATSAVTTLVPADSIVDRNSLPAPDPSIVLGEHQVLEPEGLDRRVSQVVSTVHIWKKGLSLEGVQAIAGAIAAALDEGITVAAGYHCGDCYVSGRRFLRDPDGETSHGVLTVETLIVETG